MSGAQLDDMTRLVNQAVDGDQAAAQRVWDALYEDLRVTARCVLGPRPLHDLQQPGPTEVVHEVFLRMFGRSSAPTHFENRRHFFGSMARAMAQFLVDFRRHHRREKRGGLVRTLPLGIDVEHLESLDHALLATDHGLLESMQKLEAEHAVAAEVVWLRFIAGLGLEHTATAMGIAPRTVSKHWNFARAWIRRDMERRHGPLRSALDGPMP
ncbi:MAG: ECF-type sigma factor [Phycisphaerales bacterium]|jgi:RNA polymerase sigma factor (TIGR02999 family)